VIIPVRFSPSSLDENTGQQLLPAAPLGRGKDVTQQVDSGKRLLSMRTQASSSSPLLLLDEAKT
jgi:hypothetical protein